MENEVIEIIRLLLKGVNNKKYENALVSISKNKEYYLWNCDYLLNQVIRHYDVPQERYFFSESAGKLWENLGYKIKDLKNFYYREKIIPKNNNVTCYLYTGSNSKEYKNLVGVNDCFPFKDAFHLEHIIPISTIITELKMLDDLSDESIENVLNKICVARITKKEDRDLHNKNKRDKDFDLIYKNLYKKNGIVLINNVTMKEI